MKHRTRKTCAQYIADRIARNRARTGQHEATQLEMNARRELLIGKDAAQREKEKQ
jgi:hypothetical protein